MDLEIICQLVFGLCVCVCGRARVCVCERERVCVCVCVCARAQALDLRALVHTYRVDLSNNISEPLQ
jgi:hypothetical protein